MSQPSRLLNALPRLSSLRAQILAIVLTAVLPLAAFIVYDALHHGRMAREEMHRELRLLARFTADDLDARIAGARNLLRALGEAQAVRSAPSPDCDRLLAATVAGAPRYTAMVVVDPRGELLCSSQPAETGVSYGDREWFRRALASGTATVGRPVVGRISGRLMLPVAWPVHDAGGRLTQVIAVGLKITDVGLRWLQAGAIPGLATLAWDADGRVVLRVPDGAELARVPPMPPVVLAVRQDTDGIVEAPDLDGQPRAFSHAKPASVTDLGLTFAFGVPMAEVDARAAAALGWRIALFLLVGGAMFALAWRFSERSLRAPLAQLGEAFARLRLGEYRARIAEPMPPGALEAMRRDFNDTAEALQRHADDLRQSEAQYRQLAQTLERRVAERTEELELANRAKDSFLAAMSHEVRTPLAGMMGMLEVLEHSPLDREARATLAAATASAQALARIVDDILDWSKIEAGKLGIAPVPTPVRELIERVAETYARLASAKGLAIRRHADPRVSPVLVLDPLRLSQVLNNFVSNAVKFTQRGQVEIGVDLVERGEGLERVRFWVRDTGIGMDKAVCDRLFRSYVQGAPDTALRYGGTGLGLAICRRLAGLMGGEVECRSAPGEGSTFSLTLALAPAAELPAAAPAAKGGSAPLSAAGAQAPVVLVVDDHPINRELLARQLGLLGLRCQMAESGAAALEQWRRSRFDLVITDCHMPGMDGFELARAIRAAEGGNGRDRVPIIAWTANVIREEEDRCRAAGMDETLTKPTPLALLRSTLAKWLPAPNAEGGNGAPLDPAVLAELAAGSEVESRILERLREANEEDAALVRGAVEERDLEALALAAHRIKGAARTVGATPLAGAAERVERAARAGDAEAAIAGVGDLEEKIRRLHAWLDDRGEGGHPPGRRTE